MKNLRITFAVMVSAAALATTVLPGSSASAAPSADTEQAAVTRLLVAQGGTVSASDPGFVVMPGGAHVSTGERAFGDCPSGWVCLWQDGGFSGRMLKWSDSGTRVPHLSSYGFNDEMSSWANRGGNTAYWYDDSSYDGTRHTMSAGTSSAHGGNDEASSFRIG